MSDERLTTPTGSRRVPAVVVLGVEQDAVGVGAEFDVADAVGRVAGRPETCSW